VQGFTGILAAAEEEEEVEAEVVMITLAELEKASSCLILFSMPSPPLHTSVTACFLMLSTTVSPMEVIWAWVRGGEQGLVVVAAPPWVVLEAAEEEATGGAVEEEE